MARYRITANSKKKFFLMLVIAMLLTAASTVTVYFLTVIDTIYKVEEIDMDSYIGEEVGMNIDNDSVHFGIIPPTGSGFREIIVKAGEYKTLITIESSGELGDWVSISENNFLLEPGEDKSLMVQVTIPEDAKVPDYKKGKLKITFRKA